jgi:hypothetical protein
MNNVQTGDIFFKVASILSPFIAAILTALVTYHFTVKAKRLDVLYANKIPAIKEIAARLIELNQYVGGVLAYLHANEYAGDHHPPGGALRHRADLAHAAVMNDMFLSPSTRKLVDDIVQHLGAVCGAEARFVQGLKASNPESIYELLYKEVNECMSALHADLYGKFKKQ